MAYDRAAHHREDEAWLHEAWAAPRTRAVLVGRRGVAIDPAADGAALARVPIPDDADLGAARFLGTEDGHALFSLEQDDPPGARPLLLALAGLQDEEAEIASFAAGLANWHATHGYCGRCGDDTLATAGGTTRTCMGCKTIHYPRTDPVVQIFIHDGDRCVLGRSPQWPATFFSVLAGFIEPGETPAQAAVREAAEETGLEIFDLEAAGAQAWPMPHQLLFGYGSRCADVRIAAPSDDLEEVRILTRAQLREQMADRTIMIPPRRALSGQLIRAWRDGEDGA